MYQCQHMCSSHLMVCSFTNGYYPEVLWACQSSIIRWHKELILILFQIYFTIPLLVYRKTNNCLLKKITGYQNRKSGANSTNLPFPHQKKITFWCVSLIFFSMLNICIYAILWGICYILCNGKLSILTNTFVVIIAFVILMLIYCHHLKKKLFLFNIINVERERERELVEHMEASLHSTLYGKQC